MAIPGSTTQKINAAFQIGGAALAIKTIRQFTGLDINHVMVVNFGDFKDLIDRLGGITVDVPKPIRSNRFDCPFPTQARCDRWQGWRFHKGPQHMNGERALIYSRIRENLLDPAETDVTRGARQQAVLDATAAKFTSLGTLIGVPFNGSSLAKPLTTDLTATQLVQLGWVKFRASSCRLGPLPPRRRPRRRRDGQPERGRSGDDRDVPRQVSAAASDRAVRPGLRHRAPAAALGGAVTPPRRGGRCARRRRSRECSPSPG